MSVFDSFPTAPFGRRLLRAAMPVTPPPNMRSDFTLPLPPLSRLLLPAAVLMVLAVLLVRDARAGVAGPPAMATTCETLPASMMVTNRHPDTQCRQVSGAGIGVAALVDGGAREAVDVWNVVTPGTKVCFAGTGDSIQFLDAAGMPRQPSELAANSEGDMLCATIDRPGTAVLMPGPMVVASVPAAAAAIMEKGTARARNEVGKRERDPAVITLPEHDSLPSSFLRPTIVVHRADYENCNRQWPCPN